MPEQGQTGYTGTAEIEWESAVYPSAASSKKLWSLMPREERGLAAKHFFDPATGVNPVFRNAAIAAIAKSRNSREVSIRKATREQQENWLAGNQMIIEEIADTLIRVYLLHEQLPMIEAFLDDLKVPHTKGLIEDSFDCSALSTEDLTAAARRLTEAHGVEAVELYLVYTAGSTGDWADAVKRIPLPL